MLTRIAQGWEQIEKASFCLFACFCFLMGIKFQFFKMKKFWRLAIYQHKIFKTPERQMIYFTVCIFSCILF